MTPKKESDAKDVNFRLDAEVAEILGRQAEQRGMSRQNLIEDLLRLHAEHGAGYVRGPVAVPIGFTALSKELDEAPTFGQKQNDKRTNAFIVVYRSPRGTPLALPCRIEKTTPTITYGRFHNPERVYAIPRAHIVMWVNVPNIDDMTIIREMHALQNWGALLHWGVLVAGLAVNGIHQAPPGA